MRYGSICSGVEAATLTYAFTISQNANGFAWITEELHPTIGADYGPGDKNQQTGIVICVMDRYAQASKPPPSLGNPSAGTVGG